MLPTLNRTYMPGLSEDIWNDFFTPVKRNSNVSVNIIEGKSDFRIEVAAPGMDRKNFRVDLDKDILTISAEHKELDEEKNENYVRREFGFSSFKRTFTLPEMVDAEKIKASHKDGILTINIPKKEEAKVKPPKSISIS